MKLLRSLGLSAGVAIFVTVAACSADSSSSAADSCEEAKTVADGCNARPRDGGATLKVTFDATKCEGSDQGRKAAQCIVDNKSNCDCVSKCLFAGSCS